MVTTWQLKRIVSLDPDTMRVDIDEFVDTVFFRSHDKAFPKTRTQNEVLSQFALQIKQLRQQELDDRVPFDILDLDNFENRISTA